MANPTIDDPSDTTLSSLEILAEATEMAFDAGSMDVRALRSALDLALKTGSPSAVHDAEEMYAMLEPALRGVIKQHALTLATVRRRVNRG